MPYQSTKPAAADYMSVSQGDLQGNFLALKTAIDVNHETFGSANEGKHSMVSFPQKTVSAVPPVFPLATSATELGLYAAAAGGATHLFFRPVSQTAGVATNDINLTNTSGNTIPGWYKLPNGLIMKWGLSAAFNSGSSGSSSTGTATLVSGAGIPNITTLLYQHITMVRDASDAEGSMYYYTYNDTGTHTIQVKYWKPFSGTSSARFSYLIMGF